MQKLYQRIDWENYPSEATPINETNLNAMDAAIDELDNRVITHETTKATKTEVSTVITDVSFNENTGTFTFTRKNGGTVTIDTILEKMMINFRYDYENQRLVITLDDGSVQYVDMSALLTQYEFADSETLAFSLTNGKISAIVKNGSIQEKHLRPEYLAGIKVESAKAESSAKAAATSEASAKSYAEQAKESADRAEEVVGITYATEEKAGIVSPQDIYVNPQNGEMRMTKHTTSPTLTNSHAGGIKLIGVHGKSEQKQYSGKNLLPYPYVNTTKTVNGVSYTDNGDGTVTANGTSTANTAFYFTSQMLVEAGTYTFSIGTTLPEKAICYAYDIANSKTYAQLYLNNTSATFTITEPTYISFYIVVAVSGVTYSNVVLKPQLELGNTASDYEPYVGGKASPNPDYPQSIKPVVVSEIKSVGKNQFNINGDVNVRGTDFYDNPTGYNVVENGVLTANLNIQLGYPYGQLLTGLNGKTINVSADVVSLGDGTQARIIVYENGVAVKTNVSTQTGKVSFTYTCTEESAVVAFATYGGTGAQFTNIQVEFDETTDYEEYKESVVKLSKPITLNGIGESADELVSGTKRFAEVVFDGSDDEGWVAQIGSNALTSYFYIQNPTQKANGEVLSSHFISGRSDGAEGHIWLGNTVVCLNLFNGFTTANELKGWLAEHPITVTYELAEPITEALPEADQIALHSLKSFDTVTYISTDSEVEPVIELEYGTSHVGALALENAELHAVNEILLEQLSADVEGCLPKKGGVVDEILYVGSTGATTAETVAIQNNKRKMLNQVTADGRYVLYDNTNGKAVIVSSASGATSFYGTANNAVADGSGNNIANTYVAKSGFTVDGDTLILNFL